uniref:Rho-GAP domain-containing protein n=1 Tax=Glycine max TaxID=3847 RepID=A0A0R0JJU1_SOYBN
MTKSAELSQGNGGVSIPTPISQSGPQEQNQRFQCGSGNMIFKSGPLLISSKGIGWTSWKKRWFILTQTSLVFFRSDPNAVPQKGNEVNLTLGGIDLNNSGSVVIKADKKLLTVQFPDVHDGRAFTLKAETTEDLYEWKTALENALALAPNAANVTEQNVKDREPVKSTVVGRPILLALEDVDGTPSFLEKALTFIEEHGANIEGILRQAADVDEVERRVREYEQGKVEFSPDEDAHVVGDCVKHVIRELPSSPVPASCCKALLEACRTERGSRVAAMRAAINDTFPEPNRRLLQRILMMMQTVASRKAVNRMSSSAVAACMAPLLLRPLLAGECEIENDFDVGGDGSVQLLQAAAAANHAQAICITLLEEYSSIFGGGSVSPDIYTDSEEESGSESEGATDDDDDDDDDDDYEDDDDDEQDESIHESDADDDLVSESYSGTVDSEADDEDHDHASSSSKSSGKSEKLKATRKLSSKSLEGSLTQHEDFKSSELVTSSKKTGYIDQSNKPADIVGGVSTNQATLHNSNSPSPASCIKKSNTMSNGPAPRHRTTLGRTSARKNLSMESIDFPLEDEDEIERLEAARTELQTQIDEEVKANEKLQSHVDKQKKALEERHLALEQDVARLQELLHKEKNSRVALENKAELEELALVEADLANLEWKVDEIGVRLNAQIERNHGSTSDSSNKPRQISNQERKLKHKVDAEVAATPQFDRSISKVGRSQTQNELQSMDKGRDSSRYSINVEKGKGYERPQSLPSPKLPSPRLPSPRLPSPKHLSPNRFGGSEAQSVPNPEKGKGSEAVQISEKGLSKGKSHQSSEKLKKSDSQPAHHSDGWNQQPKQLERGRSEGHQTYNADKGRSEGHQTYNVDKGR